MSSMPPKFSIIVPTLNAGKHIASALESIASQQCREYEILVIDGGSTDDTVEIAESFRHRLPLLHILSDRDGGIYGAINHGIFAASGDWILVLGSDDRLRQESTLVLVAEILVQVKSSIVYGDVMISGSNKYMAEGERYAGRLGFSELAKRNVCQQSIFYRRALFARVGGFDTRFRMCADWAFLLRHFFSESPEWMDAVVADYHAGGLSSRVVDNAFELSRPLIVLRSMLARPFDPEIQAERWLLRRLAGDCVYAGFRARALLLTIGWAVLALLSRVSPPRVSGSYS